MPWSEGSDRRRTAATKRNDEDDEDEDKTLNAKKTIKPIAVPLGHVAAKYSAKSLGEFLFQPLRVRSSGRMPDMKLTPAESLAIAGYLVGETATTRKGPGPAGAAGGERKKILSGTELRCVSFAARHCGGSSDWLFEKRGSVSRLFVENECAQVRGSILRMLRFRRLSHRFGKNRLPTRTKLWRRKR